jgi:hypothetical protein
LVNQCGGVVNAPDLRSGEIYSLVVGSIPTIGKNFYLVND